MADTGVGDLDSDLVGLGRCDFNVLVGELLAGAPGDGRLAGDGLVAGGALSAVCSLGNNNKQQQQQR